MDRPPPGNREPYEQGRVMNAPDIARGAQLRQLTLRSCSEGEAAWPQAHSSYHNQGAQTTQAQRAQDEPHSTALNRTHKRPLVRRHSDTFVPSMMRAMLLRY